ncbi:MAG TPA: DUF5941 domain-containing protein, partial [Streptosporangiaceae bacterium]|nr:DUF5941 domain-containing protein [Streptosporangiaceae bacterium]
MTVALVLAAEPAAGLCSQLTSLGVRRVDAADSAGSSGGLLTVAAAARAAGEQVLICDAGLAVPREALARLLGAEGTAGYAEAREGCRAVLVSQADLHVLAEAAEYLASRPRAPDHVSALIRELSRRGVTVRFVEARPEGDMDRDEDGLVAGLFADPIARDIARWAAERALAPAALIGTSLGLGLVSAVWFSEPTTTAKAVAAVALFAAFVSSRAGRMLAAAPGPALEALAGPGGRAIPCTGAIQPTADWLSAGCWMAAECAAYAGLAASAGIGGAVAPGTIDGGPGGVWRLAAAAMVLLAIRRMTDLCYERVTESTRGRTRLPRSARWRRAERSLALPAGERVVLLIVTGAIWGPRVAFLALLAWGTVAVGYVLTSRIIGMRDAAAQGGPAESAAADHGAIGLGAAANDQVPAGKQAAAPAAVAGSTGAAGYQIAAYRDDGPICLWLGKLVEGRLPPLPPAIVGVFVTSALAALGLGNLSGILVLSPVEAMLLAGLGSWHPHDGRLDWLVPPLLQAGEYLFLAALAFTRSVPPPLVFALLAAVALRHLDVGYRARHRIAWLPARPAGPSGRPGRRRPPAGRGGRPVRNPRAERTSPFAEALLVALGIQIRRGVRTGRRTV